MPVVRVLVQPLVEVLFRTEEVIDHSPTPLLDDNRFGVLLGDGAIHDLKGNSIGTVGAGIFDFDRFAGVLCAVDQQQKVNRSPYIEDGFALNVNGMEIMTQGPTPLAGPFCRSIA